MGILEGKRILVTGVLTDDSLAFGAARLAMDEGAEVALTGFGRGMSLTSRAARRLPGPVEVYELDVTIEEQADGVAHELEHRWGALDGIVHSIGFAPDSCLGNGVLAGELEGRLDRDRGLDLLAEGPRCGLRALFSHGRAGGARSSASTSTPPSRGPATTGWASPRPPWSRSPATSPEISGPRGIRVNLVAAGPISTVAARSIPSFERFESVWDERAPLGWDVRDSEAVARACVALLSDWFPRTTGEIVHVDGGFHAPGV